MQQKTQTGDLSHLTEHFVSREDVFDGAVLHLVRDTVRLPNGALATREMCLHVGAVCVLPLLSDGTVLMERQYRYAHGRVFFEIPAGKLNSREEDREAAVLRELREETGAVAGRLTYLGDLDPSPALTDERIGMYLAEDITFGERELDADEFLDVERVPLSTLYRMVMDGQIRDAKTQIAVLKVWQLRGCTQGA